LQFSSAPTTDPSNDLPSLPPAYRQGTLITPDAITSPGTLPISDDRTASTSLVPGRHSSRLHIGIPSPESKSFIQPQEAQSSHFPVHAAHVATDDKALLARLADLAERPPDVPESSHQVSVPVWEDEQLEDFAQTSQSSCPDTSESAVHSQFPPPPSKGKMVEPSFYAYRYSFEEFSESIEPDLEPSAPPFEAHGTSISNDIPMLPSAPPLAEGDFALEGYPDAPQFQEDAAAGDAGQGRDRSDDDRNRDGTLTHLSDGTLPGYRP